MAPTIGVNLRVTGHCNQGSRRHMEDMFSVAYQQTEDELDLEYAYFGIFDGHGGHEAATFAKEHLMKAIVSQPGFWSDNDKDVLRAIKDGFIATHYAMWRNLENWPKTQSGWPSTSGTTASIAFIRRSNIYIGHVGDSCIVLGYQDPCSDHWIGAPLTRDHKPENPIEFKRISQAGGMVVQKSGVPRVVWHRPRISHKGPLTRSTHIDQIPFLAVARSLGDLWSYNADSDRFVVSPEPDVSVHHIDLTRDRCLIFGTDGLWNMLTPDEAVSIVKKAEFNNKKNGGDGQDQAWLNPSKCLVDSALSKWMKFELRADNTSAVTLLLDPLGPPHSHVLDQQNSASKPQSEFVPYHIESYKVNEGKSPSKLHSQSSGLAICTWYPHKNLSENLNKNDGMTTLSTMEELFGKKVEIYDGTKAEDSSDSKSEQSQKGYKSLTDVLVPSTSKSVLHKDNELKKLSPMYSTVLKNPYRNSGGTVGKSVVESDKGVQDSVKELSTKIVEDDAEVKKDKNVVPVLKDENENQGIDENINKMKLRGSLSNKISEQKMSGELPIAKNDQRNSLQTKTMRRSGKRGKKRKNYDVIKSQLRLLGETKCLRSKSKRRHSSLLETMNLMYEPKPKRRTRSEDQKKLFDNEEYKSDTENKLDEEPNKSRKINKLKGKSSETGRSPETPDETQRQNHLQERLQHNNNNSNNNGTNSNNNNNSSSSSSSSSHSNNNHNSSNNNNNNNNNNHINSTTVNNSNSSNNNNNSSSSLQDFTPMRLRSNMPVKTLRSRNINLEICDWFLLGLTKINVNSNKRSLSKQNYKSEESTDSTKDLSKINVLTRSSMSSSKIQVNDSPNKSTVHTRSQNKRLKK